MPFDVSIARARTTQQLHATAERNSGWSSAMQGRNWHDLMSEVPRVTVGGLQVAALTRNETAELMITVAKQRARTGPPPLFTSANGEVLSRCSSSHSIRSLFEPADLINADGQPMVFASRALASRALPERVATSDLFHDVAIRAVGAQCHVRCDRRHRGRELSCCRKYTAHVPWDLDREAFARLPG